MNTLTPANSHAALPRQKRPPLRQQALKPLPRTAGAWIIAAELLHQLHLAAAHKAQAAFDVRFGWIAFAAFRADLESRGGR